MTTPYVTVSNIIAGPCTSFLVDANPVGGTSAGVTMERAVTYTDLEVDQIVGPIKMAANKDVMTVTTELSEATLANLQLAFNLANAPVVATSPATTTLDVGIIASTIEHTLTFVGPAPTTNGHTTRTFTLHRAVNMGKPKMTIIKGKEQVFQVQFTLMPDLTQPAGSEFGTIVDQ